MNIEALIADFSEIRQELPSFPKERKSDVEKRVLSLFDQLALSMMQKTDPKHLEQIVQALQEVVRRDKRGG